MKGNTTWNAGIMYGEVKRDKLVGLSWLIDLSGAMAARITNK
jgi:hypothetical protein